MIFYLHGFNSLASGNGKIKEVSDFFGENVIPLDYDSGSDFTENLLKLMSIIDSKNDDNLMFMGTSLGGYYAAQLASLYKGKAIMLNPALRPYEQLMHFLGENKNFSTGEEYFLRESTILSYPKIEIPSEIIFFINKNDELIPSEETVSFAIENNIDYILFPEGGHRFDSLVKVLEIIKEKNFYCS